MELFIPNSKMKRIWKRIFFGEIKKNRQSKLLFINLYIAVLDSDESSGDEETSDGEDISHTVLTRRKPKNLFLTEIVTCSNTYSVWLKMWNLQ